MFHEMKPKIDFNKQFYRSYGYFHHKRTRKIIVNKGKLCLGGVVEEYDEQQWKIDFIQNTKTSENTPKVELNLQSWYCAAARKTWNIRSRSGNTLFSWSITRRFYGVGLKI